MIGNYKESINDFSKAIEDNGNFAEAFYNRGLIHILLNETVSGCEDLSRAGELGILDAYKVMKRYCNK
jgi:tetratricopeptide (TPR) repeat protein